MHYAVPFRQYSHNEYLIFLNFTEMSNIVIAWFVDLFLPDLKTKFMCGEGCAHRIFYTVKILQSQIAGGDNNYQSYIQN